MTPFELAQRFVGELHEFAGKKKNHPFIQWCFMLCGWGTDTPDEVPWCSVFANGVCWLLRLPRSKNARARSWLAVGTAVSPWDAEVGYDVVILKRGGGDQPGPEVLDAPGHVGFFAGYDRRGESGGITHVLVLGGNQGDSVTVAPYSFDRILGVRRLK